MHSRIPQRSHSEISTGLVLRFHLHSDGVEIRPQYRGGMTESRPQKEEVQKEEVFLNIRWEDKKKFIRCVLIVSLGGRFRSTSQSILPIQCVCPPQNNHLQGVSQGLPLAFSFSLSHLEPKVCAFSLQHLGQRWQVLRYTCRGLSSSDPGVSQT